MEIINSTLAIKKSAERFVKDVYSANSKPVLFWDSCALLDILRFIYRDNGDPLSVIDDIKKISDKIVNGNIYSVSSSTVIKELNDNYEKVIIGLVDSLKKTSKYHADAIGVINNIDSTSLSSVPLFDKQLDDKLKGILSRILQNTYFIDVNNSIVINAYNRVLEKNPPSGKKEQNKDSVIWATAVLVFKKIKRKNTSHKNVFYTSNTNDFCYEKNRGVLNNFNYMLVSEASTWNFTCCKSTSEVMSSLFPAP